jgi:hypothetical protein
MWEELGRRTIGGCEEEETQEVNEGEEPMWPMLDKEPHSTVSPVAKKDIMPGTAHGNKEKGEQE